MHFDTDYRMLINGELVGSDETIDVINPAIGHVFASAPDCSLGQLDRAVSAAAAAYAGWRQVPLPERQAALRQAADRIEQAREDLARLFTREQGRPVDGARMEIDMAIAWLRGHAQMAPPEDRRSSDGQDIEIRYVPLGVVCAISPWNFPVVLAIWKIAPALLAGNTIVLKPSPYTPLCMLKIGELLRDVFPDGVLNVISGNDDLGPAMTAHPGFAKIAFTGSTATGKRVLEAAAKDLKRVTLELGGNDAAIVMPDVDVAAVAQQIFMGAFFNTAQVCVASKRLYVHNDVYDALRDQLVSLAQAIVPGDGAEQGVLLGPLQNRRQFDRVQALVEDARQEGLTLIEGAPGPQGDGYFLPATIVDNPPESARVVQEEAFGPVLPMLRFNNVDEMIARVNASDYGLAAAVWSNDRVQALEIGRRIEAGTVWINQNLVLRPDLPFAGHKQSGFGVENGIEGLLEYMVPQVLYCPSQADAPADDVAQRA